MSAKPGGAGQAMPDNSTYQALSRTTLGRVLRMLGAGRFVGIPDGALRSFSVLYPMGSCLCVVSESTGRMQVPVFLPPCAVPVPVTVVGTLVNR